MNVPMEQARAHVLVKQGLAGPGLGSVMEAVVATAGIYGTSPTCYLSCAARIPGFRLADLDKELYEERSAVRLRCVRGMAYIQPLDLLPALFACTGEARDKTLTRIAKWTDLTEDEVLALADHIEKAMTGQSPMTVPEIRKLLGEGLPGNKNALQMTVALMGRYGRIVRAQARGTWRSDLYPYARWSEWLDAPVEDVDPAAARAEIARRYLRAYGPATTNDLKWWTGWTKRDTVPALAALGEEATEVSLDGLDAWALTDELETLGAAEGGGVRLLPVWDSYFMGYATSPAGRARQVAEADYPRVYDTSGNGTSTVIVDGMAAGVWELDADGGKVEVAPFAKLPWDAVEAQVAVLAESIGTGLRLVRAAEPGPLSDGPRNTFLSPISLRRNN